MKTFFKQMINRETGIRIGEETSSLTGCRVSEGGCWVTKALTPPVVPGVHLCGTFPT